MPWLASPSFAAAAAEAAEALRPESTFARHRGEIAQSFSAAPGSTARVRESGHPAEHRAQQHQAPANHAKRHGTTTAGWLQPGDSREVPCAGRAASSTTMARDPAHPAAEPVLRLSATQTPDPMAG